MTLAYDDGGKGATVLLLHSGVCDRRMWRPQVESLMGSYRVLAPDLRGFGETPLEPGGFSYVADVVELLDEVRVERTFVVGSSFGGKVAMQVAAAVPDRVLGLLLLCPAYPGLPPTPTAVRFDDEETELLTAGDIDGAVELNVESWLGPDADAAAARLVRSMQRRAFELQLPADDWPDPAEPNDAAIDLNAIAAATLVVSGDLDMDHFRAIARHLVDNIDTARLITLPWAAHLPSLERPSEVTSLMERFVGELATLR